MRHNPLSDTIAFLLQPGWITAAFWLLLLASVAVAVYAFRSIPGQRRIEYRQLGFSCADWVHVVAANSVEIASLLHRPP